MTESRFADEDTLAHIAQLEAENARLNNEVVKLREELAASERTREGLVKFYAGAVADANRYRWLRIQDRDDLSFAVLESAHWRGAGDCDPDFFDNSEELDAAIDAAMKEKS